MNEQQMLLNEIRMYDFAMVDSSLFLDSHPQDAAALAYYTRNRKLYDEAKARYESTYGPLSRRSNLNENEWRWIDDPWPWEGADN